LLLDSTLICGAKMVGHCVSKNDVLFEMSQSTSSAFLFVFIIVSRNTIVRLIYCDVLTSAFMTYSHKCTTYVQVRVLASQQLLRIFLMNTFTKMFSLFIITTHAKAFSGLPEPYQSLTRALPEPYQSLTRALPEPYQSLTRALPEPYQSSPDLRVYSPCDLGL
jgi:hypothetical protein